MRVTKIFLFIICTCFFNSCTNSNNLKIGLLLPDANTEYYTQAWETIENKITSAGGKVLMRSADEDENRQISQAKELIKEGVSVIIISSINTVTADAIVRYAIENKVKVIAYDRIIANSDLDYYITYNSVEVGRMMASYAVAQKPKGNYILMYGDNNDRNAIFVKQGFHKIIDPYVTSGDINIMYRSFTTNWNGINAAHTLEKILDFSDDQPDVILSSYDGMSTSAIQILDKYNLNKKVLVTGQNGEIEAFRNIINGKQAMTVYKPAQGLASLAADIAIKLIQNQKIETTTTINNGRKDVPTILLDPIFIDKNNIDKLIVEKGIYTHEELYR